MKATTEKSSSSASTPQTASKPFFAKAGGGDFFAPAVQTKLNVGPVGGHHEQEADSVAEQVVHGDSPVSAISGQAAPGGTTAQRKPLSDGITPFVQRKEVEEEPVQKAAEKEDPVQTASIQRAEEEKDVQQMPVQRQEDREEPIQKEAEGGDEEVAPTEETPDEEPSEEADGEAATEKESGGDETVQEKPIQRAEEKEEAVQAKMDTSPSTSASPSVESSLGESKGMGSKLPGVTQQSMESGFGADFSGVKIHTDATAVRMNQQLQAKAFTHGSDIYFNEGKFNPSTDNGKKLLAHELTHTIQQGKASGKQPASLSVPEPTKPASTKPGVPADAPVSDPAAALNTPEKQVEETALLAKAPVEAAALPASQPAVQSGVLNAPAPSSASMPTVDAPALKTGTKGAASQPSASAPQPVVQPEEGTEAPKADGKPDQAITPRSPEEDPNFQALKGRSEGTAASQKVHPAAGALAQNAGDAATVPSNEKAGQAQANQVETMSEQEPQVFNAAAFKEALMGAIAKQLPTDEESADKFPESGKMDQVKQEAGKGVDAEKQNTAGAIQQASSQAPNTDTVPNRQVAALNPPKPGAKPANLGAEAAMPPLRSEAEVSKPLQENSQQVDNQMAANNVTDEQLAKSEEPSFTTALDSKKTAQEHSATAPGEFRQSEQSTLEKSQGDAAGIDQKQVAEMFGDRKNLLGKAGLSQQQTSGKNTSERERISNEINKIYQKTKTDVEAVLGTPDGSGGSLDASVDAMFDQAAIWANLRFENFVRKEMDAYKKERYGEWFDPRGWGTRVADAFTGLPPEVNKIYVDAKEAYLTDMDGVLTRIAGFIANTLASVKARINRGRQEVKAYIDNQPAHLKKIAAEAGADIQDKFNSLDDAIISKQEALIDLLAQKYSESLSAVDAKIEEMKAANRGLIDKAMDAINGVIETINKLRKMISELLSAIQSLINVIMADPIDFMKTLFAGIGQGIDNFKANIEKHLIGGLFTWLTGALGPIGIQVPENIFSLSGIFSLVMQVLGLGWDFIRKKLLMVLPAPAVEAVETGLEVIKVIREKGLAGLWEFVKDKFNDLKETVIDAIKNMLITKVIEAGIKWLLSLLIPGAGFIKAIMAIKDVVVFFVESAMMLIPALIDGIKAAAAKNFGGIAAAIENGIAKLIPLVIGLLARLLGIGGLTKKVQDIIKKIRKRIDKEVNKLIVKAKAWVKKMWGKGKAGVKKIKEKVFDWLGITKKFKNKDGEEHTLLFSESGKQVMIASSPKPVVRYLAEIRKKHKDDNGKISLVEKAENHLAEIEKLKKLKQPNKNNISVEFNKLGDVLKEIGGENEFFNPIPEKRYLPVDFKVRNNLYINGSSFESNKKIVRDNQIAYIKDSILKMESSSLVERSYLWGELVAAGQVYANDTPKAKERYINPANFRKTNSGQGEETAAQSLINKIDGKDAHYKYEVDHILPLAKHWAENGFNSNDVSRQGIAGKPANLKLILQHYNRSAAADGHEYAKYFYVGPKFSSIYNNSPIGAKKIKNQDFRLNP